MTILADSYDANMSVTKFIIAIMPVCVLIGLLVWVTVSAKRRERRARLDGNAYMDRANRHMDAVEAKLDQLIQEMQRQRGRDA